MDNLRRFVVVFTILLAVALSVTGFFLALKYNNVSEGRKESIPVDTTTYTYEDNTIKTDTVCKNILFAVGEPDDEETTLLFILNINTSNNTMNFLFIPKDLEYSIETKDETGENVIGTVEKFSTLCRRESIESCASVLSSVLDIPLNTYIYMGEEAFVNFFNVFSSREGGFSYDIPVSFSYTNNGRKISFTKGVHSFSGKDVYDYVRFYKTDDNTYPVELYRYYNGTDVNRLKMFRSLVSSFINNQFIMSVQDYYSQNFVTLFRNYVVGLCTTNIDLQKLETVSKYLSALQKKSVNYFIIDGSENYNGELYIQYNGNLLDLSDSEETETTAKEIFPVYFN